MPNKSLSTDGRRRILIVEDEAVLAKNIAIFLRRAGAQVRITHSGDKALSGAQGFNPDCMLVDYNLPGMNGLETISRLQDSHPGALFVLMSAQDSGVMRNAAHHQGVRHILTKPFPLRELRICLDGDVRRTNPEIPAMAEASRREEFA